MVLVSSANTPQVEAAWIAIVGTLLGALVGGGMQAWQNRRSLEAARREAEAQRKETRAALTNQLLEERLHRLWAERRSIYSQLLDITAGWISAIRDVRDLNLSENEQLNDKPVRTLGEAREQVPESAEMIQRMYDFGRMEADVTLLSDREVRAAVEVLARALRKAARQALDGQNGMPEVTRAHAIAVAAMRHELVVGTYADSNDNSKDPESKVN